MKKNPYYKEPILKNLADRSICLTGIGRSGTTILGAVVHSFKKVEYAFEPPELIPLFHFFESIPINLWKYLYEFYLFEKIFSDSLSGRSFNFNESDWSCIYRSKTKEEILQRMSSSLRRRQILNLTSDKYVAYKIPNIVNRVQKLKENYTETKLILTIRHPDEVVRSTLERGWYQSPINLATMRNTEFGPIPAFIDETNAKYWLNLTEIDKCYDSFCQVYSEEYLTEQMYIIDFAMLCKNPQETSINLANRIGLEYGDKTEQLLKTIKKPQLQIDRVSGYTSSIREKALVIYKLWLDQCMQMKVCI